MRIIRAETKGKFTGINAKKKNNHQAIDYQFRNIVTKGERADMIKITQTHKQVFQGYSFPQALRAMSSGSLEMVLDLLCQPISQVTAVFTKHSGLEMLVEAANSV